MRILEQFRLFFFSYRGHSTSWHIRAMCQGRGQRSNGAINRNKHLARSFCRGISNLVTLSLTVAELWEREREREREKREREREREERERERERGRGREEKRGEREKRRERESVSQSVSQTKGDGRVYFMDVTLKDWSFRHRDTCQSNSVARVRTTVFLRNVSNRHWHFSWKQFNWNIPMNRFAFLTGIHSINLTNHTRVAYIHSVI